ncbi:MAG: polysaccharide polymerase, partial [Rickettsiaceae bacterium]|nr:polysaccharide polymerase [Rickettsiaceae bacterium]
DEDIDVIYFHEYKWHPLPLHPHNCFMHIWLECGIIGLILLAFALVQFLTNIEKIYLTNHDLLWLSCSLAGFTNYFLISQVSYGMWQVWWICTGMINCILMANLKKIRRLED